ncbi:calcium-binding protein, partial [Sulfurisoma sediminicola]|uniref:calcium-binding protein n=1 Tax=Sulfurisoma sediminicola TaxID=1381557 RepID=UPI0023B95DB8
MTDSLAIYNLLATLDANLNGAGASGLYRITPLLEASANVADRTLENMVNALGNLFKAGTTITSAQTDQREALYARIKAIQDNQLFTQSAGLVSVRDLTQFSSTQIASIAQNNLAYRYALRELNPFAILGADYTAHNADGALDLYDEATGTGELSALWLADRAALLTWRLRANTDDIAPVGGTIRFDGAKYGSKDTRNWEFSDLGTDAAAGQKILVQGSLMGGTSKIVFGTDQRDGEMAGGSDADRLYGNLGDDTIHGNGGGDTLEGNAGQDKLFGDAGADTLVGGTGNDELTGGKDTDTLLGGAGTDTYIFTSGDGWDWIDDSDGTGSIQYDGVTLGTAITKQSTNVWRQTVDGKTFTYSLYDWTEDNQTFKVLSIVGGSTTGGGMWVKRWQNGQLGITLPGAMTPPPELAPAAVEPVTRTSAWYNQDHTVIDARGLPAMEIRAQGDYGEVWGSGRLYGNASDNYLHNGDGDDELYGYGGRDVLIATGGDDKLHGGDGDDALQGGDGNDLLEGEAGDDVLAGGLGSDVLDGGDGDDYLNGASALEALRPDWSVVKQDHLRVFQGFTG